MNNSSLNSSSSAVWCVTFSCQGIFILISNVLTIVTFSLNRHLRKRSVYLLINLSVADLLVGLFPVPLYVYFVGVTAVWWSKLSPPTNRRLTYVFTYLDIFLGLASIVTLAFISLERMRATVWPLRHRQTTNRMYGCAIGITWVLATLIAGLTSCIKIFYFEYDVYAAWISVSVLLVSLLIILTSYTIVFASFKLSIKRNARLGHPSRILYRENRLAMTLFIVTLASLLAWVPFVVLNGIYYYTDISFSKTAQNTTKLLHYMNSLINTVIYASRMPDFKRALIHLMCKCSRYQGEAQPLPTIPLCNPA